LTAVVEDSLFFGTPAPKRAEAARTPVAVAVEHQPDGPGAPRVIAKGRGALAEQILQIAFDRGVKVRSDADLAEILATIEVESEIPLEALAAVAEILSYVYRTQAKTQAKALGGPGP
jgi:flagellar biosynthesis protein